MLKTGERNTLMDKKKAWEKSKKAVSVFFRIRRGFLVYSAFSIGILSGITLYGEVYQHFRNKPYSVFLCVLAGVFITGAMLLLLKLKWFGIAKAKGAGLKLYDNYKERKLQNESEKAAEIDREE